MYNIVYLYNIYNILTRNIIYHVKNKDHKKMNL